MNTNNDIKPPIHIISLGAGVQSSTMALMAAKGEIGPMPHCAIFADTQDEPASVYAWLGWLEKQMPFPVHRVTRGKLSERALKMKVTKDGRRYSTTDIPFFTLSETGGMGKIKSRGCTADFKINPIISKGRSLVAGQMTGWRKNHKSALKAIADWRKECKRCNKLEIQIPMRPESAWMECQNDALVVQWIGISLDEIRRMKESRDPWIRHEWPLVDARMNRHNCLIWMERNGYPKPPRSACVYCPYHNDAEWIRLKRDEPAEFEKAVQFEKAIGKAKRQSSNFDCIPFLHRSCKPLSEIDFSTEEERGQINMFNNECEGMCGV